MQYTHVTTITTNPGKMPEFLRRAETEILPLYRSVPGFVAYTVTKTGESTAVTFGVWQTRQQAEESVKTSNRWMNKGGAGVLVDALHNSVGELPFLAFSSDLGVYSSPTLANGARV
jgi:hypothetical protein